MIKTAEYCYSIYSHIIMILRRLPTVRGSHRAGWTLSYEVQPMIYTECIHTHISNNETYVDKPEEYLYLEWGDSFMITEVTNTVWWKGDGLKSVICVSLIPCHVLCSLYLALYRQSYQYWTVKLTTVLFYSLTFWQPGVFHPSWARH